MLLLSVNCYSCSVLFIGCVNDTKFSDTDPNDLECRTKRTVARNGFGAQLKRCHANVFSFRL